MKSKTSTYISEIMFVVWSRYYSSEFECTLWRAVGMFDVYQEAEKHAKPGDRVGRYKRDTLYDAQAVKLVEINE